MNITFYTTGNVLEILLRQERPLFDIKKAEVIERRRTESNVGDDEVVEGLKIVANQPSPISMGYGMILIT